MAKKKAGRASNGMGSIRQRSDGRWEARYSAPDGRQKSVYGKTEKEATAKLRVALHEIDSGMWLEPSRATMAQWLETWLNDYQAHTTGRTVQTYRSVITKHMLPVFGDVRLSSFSSVHVRRMINDMTKSGLSPNTVHHARAILRAAMACAVETGLVRDNPVEAVKSKRVSPKRFTIIDRENIPAFLDAASNLQDGNALVFLLLTGVRIGEQRGLRWEDVDLEAKTIKVERQLYTPSKARREFRQPKDGEKRTIHITPETVELLKTVRQKQLENRLRAGDKWCETEFTRDLVFREPNGDALIEDKLRRHLYRVRDKLQLPDLRLHDLRHSYAVAALRSGVDVKTVQHNLGHQNASVTLDTYATYTDDAGKVGAEKLSEYWRKSLE